MDALVCLVAQRLCRVVLANRIEKAYSYCRRVNTISDEERRFKRYFRKLAYEIPCDVIPRR